MDLVVMEYLQAARQLFEPVELAHMLDTDIDTVCAWAEGELTLDLNKRQAVFVLGAVCRQALQAYGSAAAARVWLEQTQYPAGSNFSSPKQLMLHGGMDQHTNLHVYFNRRASLN